MNNQFKNDFNDFLLNHNYDINDSDIKNTLQSIINENTNDISTKESILCRILSINEYNKFVINDTLDGSITKSDDNVWHKFVPQGYTNNLFVNWGQRLDTATLTSYYENYSDNTTNITPRIYTYSIVIGACYAYPENNGSWTRANRTSPNNDNKNLSIISSNITVYRGDKGSFDNATDYWYTGVRVYYNEYKTFRPVFNYIDNKKSNDIFN